MAFWILLKAFMESARRFRGKLELANVNRFMSWSRPGNANENSKTFSGHPGNENEYAGMFSG
jgi:hypothetical protein